MSFPPNRAIVFLICLITSAVIAYPTTAAPNDGIPQPGDRFGGSKYCTIGPNFENFVFSPAHCAPIGDGVEHIASGGANSNPLSDWRVGVAGQAPTTLTTWTDCPSVRTSASDPVTTGSCRSHAGDIPISGVIKPWIGMSVQKSGGTTGTSSGTVATKWSDWPSSIEGMYLCRGDSGSPVYTQIGGEYFLVGIANWGNGSVDPSKPGLQNGDLKACYQTADAPGLQTNALTIELLCPHLPTNAGTRCINQATSPRGRILSLTIDDGGAVLSGFGFDPDTAASAPLSNVTVLVDGAPQPQASVAPQPFADAATYQLSPRINFGFEIRVPALGEGRHEICLQLGNEPGTDGIDVQAGCQTVEICQGRSANPILGTDGSDVLVGTDAVDAIYGLGGDDHLEGQGENDCLYGGAGNDVLLGNDGNDLLAGGDDSDQLYGGAGSDQLHDDYGDNVLEPDQPGPPAAAPSSTTDAPPATQPDVTPDDVDEQAAKADNVAADNTENVANPELSAYLVGLLRAGAQSGGAV